MDKSPPKQLLESIYQLLPSLQIESVNPRNPIKVSYLPEPWRLLGKGNYAAVVYHPNHPESVVKIYAPGRPGYEEEVEVYSIARGKIIEKVTTQTGVTLWRV